MRNLSDAEKQKLYDSLKAEILRQMEQMDQNMIDKIRNGYSGTLSFTHAQIPTNHPRSSGRSLRAPYGLSPTDVSAKGKYEYQEPEQDEQGTYYGYKILIRRNEQCDCPACSALVSPRYAAVWINGELEAHAEPSERSMDGIHFTKRPDHPELDNPIYHKRTGGYYIGIFDHDYPDQRKREKSVLVKCALSGTVIETEQGFRAQYAQIIGVFEDGHWQAYQDYSQRSTRHPYRTSEPWQDDWKRYGGWDTGPNSGGITSAGS